MELHHSPLIAQAKLIPLFITAALTYYPDVRLTLAVTGLEAFVNTYRHRSTARFKKRIALISKEVGMEVPEVFAEKVYDHRSSVVHGKGLQEQAISREFKEMFEILETLLRKLVRKCVEDPGFSRRFDTESTIDATYPP